jgi:hypothetical protein
MSKREDPIGIVVGNAKQAHHAQRDLDPKGRKFRVLHPESNSRGYRFDFLIITDSFYHEAYYGPPERGRRMGAWLEELKCCTMNKGGRVVRL